MVQNLSIGRKLLLMLFLPMSGLAIVTGGYVLEVRRTAGNAEDVAQLARLASTINAFLHQTQRERGRTGLFVASEGRDAGPELVAQRAATDSAATALEVQLAALRRERLGGDFNASLDTAVTRYFRRLGEHRSEVDALRLGSQAATGYYTGMNRAFLQVILRLGALSRDGHLAMLFDVYGSLLYAKEAAGMQRALLSGAFTRGRFSDGAEFQAFLLAAGEESSQLTNFLGAASPAERMLYDSVVQGTDEREVARLRGYALASAGRAPLTGATAGAWFKVSTRRIDQLMRVTDRLAAEVEERAQQLAVRSRRLWVASLLGAVVVLCGALALALRVGRGLARGLGQTMTALEAVAAGDLSQELAVEGRDEVARMAAALNRAIGAQRQALAEVRTQVSRAESAAEAARQAGLEAQAASDRQRAMEAAAGEREREHAERERLDLEERRRRDEAQAEAIRLRDREQAAHEREESERLRASVDRILEVVNAAAEGDLTRAVPDLGTGAIGQLGGGLAQFLTDLRGSVGHIATAATALASAAEELTATSQTLSTGAEETSAQAGVVSAGSTQVACSVQSVAAAAEEMDTSIREIARNATEAAQVAAEAVEVVAGANAAMAKLGASSHEIGDVMKVITSIAEQTNLLALNATIEAARAGEAGRGFGIVANEVKDLARGTARATEEISARIEAIQVDTTAAVAAIQRISRIIAQISDRQTAIAGAVEEQSVTTREIGRSVGEAARGADEITRSITGVATAAQGTSQGANHTREASGELARLASDLQALVGSFRYQDVPTPTPSP